MGVEWDISLYIYIYTYKIYIPWKSFSRLFFECFFFAKSTNYCFCFSKGLFKIHNCRVDSSALFMVVSLISRLFWVIGRWNSPQWSCFKFQVSSDQLTLVISCFFMGIISGQIIATSHDLTRNGGLVREVPLFQGNPGWWNIMICPDYIIQLYNKYNKPL